MRSVNSKTPLLFLGLLTASFVIPRGAKAQDCSCDHVVPLDATSISGSELGIGPGEVVCVEAGSREFLRIFDVMGSAESPVQIVNCGGRVEIDNDDRGYGLTLSGSSFVRITGTGSPEHEYGFSIRASRTGPDYSASCVVASGFSTDYEIDHIEAFDCGFAGVSAKTDPTCDDRDLSEFVQRNTQLHHLYLHDMAGEGIYFGSTGFPSRRRTCSGQEVDLIPHSHEGVWIFDNVIEDTGWDGMQVGVSPHDCYVYRNRVARVGLRMEEHQMQGLQIGGGSRCEITDNFFSTGPATGIIVLDSSDTLIANNVLEGFIDGVYINDRDSPASEGAQYRVVHNTLVSMQDRGITLYGQRSSNNGVINNLVVAGGDAPIGIGGDVEATSAGNLILDEMETARFVDFVGENFQLADGSPAIDAGVAGTDWGVTTDQRGAARDASPDAGAFEFGAEPPDEPSSPPGPGANPSAPGGDGGDGGNGDGEPADGGPDGGCSCRNASTPPAGSLGYWIPWLALGGLLLRRRGSRRNVASLRASLDR